MFRWSQNGRSRSTESSNPSGEEFFQPWTAVKTWRSLRFQVRFEYRSRTFKQLPGLKKTKTVMYILLQSWIQLLERLVMPQPIKWLQKWSRNSDLSLQREELIWTRGRWYFDPSFIQHKINDVLKPDLMSVVTAHMVYFCAFARSDLFPKTPGNEGWVAGNSLQASMG